MIRPSYSHQSIALLSLTLIVLHFVCQLKIVYQPRSLTSSGTINNNNNNNNRIGDTQQKSPSSFRRVDLEDTVTSNQNSHPNQLNITNPSSLSDRQEKCPSRDDDVPPAAPPLRDIHMVMIGDSLMRYQYLSLAYRLRHGVWFDDSQWYYHLVNEKTFADPFHNHTWGAFLFHTNRILQPYELCDCHRKHVAGMQDIVENRYYYDPVLNNSLVYLLAYGHAFPMVGRLTPQQARQPPRGWQIKAFRDYHSGKFWKHQDWSDVIRNHVQQLDPQPRHIVMNAGAWKHRFTWSPQPPPVAGTTNATSNSETGQLSGAAKNLFRAINDTHQYQYVWRTTTYSKQRENIGWPSDPNMCEHSAIICVNASFTSQVRQNLYWDRLHFFEPVYRAVNEEMLEVLGYLPKNYMKMNLSDILEE